MKPHPSSRRQVTVTSRGGAKSGGWPECAKESEMYGVMWRLQARNGRAPGYVRGRRVGIVGNTLGRPECQKE